MTFEGDWKYLPVDFEERLVVELDLEKIKPDLTLVGLDSRNNQRRFASMATRRAEFFDLDRAISRLKQIRRSALVNMDSFKERFAQQALEKVGTEVFYADDAAAAVAHIGRLAGQEKNLAINRASVIRELSPLLEKRSYNLVSTYLAGSLRRDSVEKTLNNYWQLPLMLPQSVYESFVGEKVNTTESCRDYTAILGVTAAAAEDGSLYFLQHTSNVGTMLREARQLVLIVGIEKIVETRDDALLQTKCMGLFGMESVILDLSCPDKSQEAKELETLPLNNVSPEIHVIILDNGRSEIAGDDQFADLLTCISCRACAKYCPTHRYFSSEAVSYPKQYLWSFLLSNNNSLDLCTGCGMCHMACPLDIDIPRLVSTARNRDLSNPGRLMKNRMLNDAWYQMLTVSRLGPLVNLSLTNKMLRTVMENISGYHKDAWVPRARSRTFDQWICSHKNRKAG